VDEGVAGFQQVIDEVPGAVEAQVPPLVTTALAADGTVSAAASAAVAGKLAEAGVMAAKPLVTGEAVWSITDTNGRRSWIEIAADGGPSAQAAAVIARRAAAGILADSLLSVPKPVDTDAAVWGITDSAGRRSWLEIAANGAPTEHAKTLIFKGYTPPVDPAQAATEPVPEVTGASPARKLYVNNGYTAARQLITDAGDPHDPFMTRDGAVIFDSNAGRVYSKVPSTGVYPVLGTAALAFFGDSLTDSGPNDVYPQRVATRTGLSVYQGGIAGQSSADVALRQGGLVPLLTVTADTIPASGAVTVTAISPATGYRVNGTGTYTFGGTLAGIPGTLTHALTGGYGWTFTRTSAGSATPCPPGTPFVIDPSSSTANELKTQIIWVGRNNFSAGYADLADAKRDVASMVAFLKPYHKRYIVVSVTNGKSEIRNSTNYRAIVEHNAYLAATYGPRYYDLRRDFIDKGLTMAGITPTAADTTAIANDAPPPSLMFDELHPTDPVGYTVVGDLISDFIISKGWNL
jgi:hypothetical protein